MWHSSVEFAVVREALDGQIACRHTADPLSSLLICHPYSLAHLKRIEQQLLYISCGCSEQVWLMWGLAIASLFVYLAFKKCSLKHTAYRLMMARDWTAYCKLSKQTMVCRFNVQANAKLSRCPLLTKTKNHIYFLHRIRGLLQPGAEGRAARSDGSVIMLETVFLETH